MHIKTIKALPAALENERTNLQPLPSYDADLVLWLAQNPEHIDRTWRAWINRAVSVALGLSGRASLLTDKSVKLEKSNALGFEHTLALHLAPAALSGREVCAAALRYGCKCREVCLNISGKGYLSSTQAARVRKTNLYFEHRALFLAKLSLEIYDWTRKGFPVAIRPNATSDIPWERVAPWLFTTHPNVRFYDYTKDVRRFRRALPDNYRLCLSRHESNDSECLSALAGGRTVAVVFRDLSSALDNGWNGFPVIDGTKDDRRFDDPPGTVVGLDPLGNARHDRSGFVVENG